MNRLRRRLNVSYLLALLIWLFSWIGIAAQEGGPQVDVLTFKGPVTPVLVSYIDVASPRPSVTAPSRSFFSLTRPAALWI